MTLIRVYIWNQKLIIPRVVQTEDGFFADVGPVEVFTTAKFDDWKAAILAVVIRGNETVPTPDGSDQPGSAILEHFHIAKWSTFERQAIMYTLHFGGRYISLYRTGKGVDGMWINSQTNQRRFDPRAPLNTVIDLLLSDMSKQPEFKPPTTGLMVLPKPPPAEDSATPSE
jgi:hypothetical protein